MASSHQKYIKYKKKYLDLKKNRTLKGGLLDIDSTFSNVTSFGFEFELTDIMPFTGKIDTYNRSLILKPFGYNENSSDDTQNRSMKKINLPDIIVDNLVGKFVLTQDSHVILESDEAYATSLTSMTLTESLTNALDKNKDAFTIKVDPGKTLDLDYDAVKFNVDISTNLTIGYAEFVCTFKTSNTNIFNINNCSQSIIDRLKQYISGPVSNYIGYINIEYEHCSINGGKKECHIKQKWFDLIEIKLTENIYILVESGIINDMNNMYDQLYCLPQITLGVPITSVKNVILQLAKSALYSVNADSESHTELSRRYEMLKDIETFTDYLVRSAVHRSPEIAEISSEDRDVLLNYLFFYYSYANVNKMFNYQFKENDRFLEIHKYAKRYLPRQHFHEILNKTPNLLKCVRLIYDLTLDIIFSYRIQYLESIISNPDKHMFVFDYDNIFLPPSSKYFKPSKYLKKITTNPLLKLHDYIDTYFPKASKDRRGFIIKILKHDMKMFYGEQNDKMDNITTFTTRIPYDSHHVLFEYRFLSSKILNFLETSGKINKFNENLTLNNIEFALNSYNSNYLFNNIPEEKQSQYNKLKIDNEQTQIKNSTIFLKNINKLKIDNEQTQIKNSTIFLKNINKDMYQDIYGDVLEERAEPDRDIVQ